jgi:hypothetical protein
MSEFFEACGRSVTIVDELTDKDSANQRLMQGWVLLAVAPHANSLPTYFVGWPNPAEEWLNR